ncbi:unnamed protein product [Cuscuta epithymum]|uniref:NAC domain-containing protein n=1 Tax=Cuscuta epithymum TaxID=186058 RepID=A0AAV0F3E4_9ASTE|nr:unnamed protein product [Cuscuta epithymum]
MGSRDSSQLLAPGFRFHPTDEELVVYYLQRKIRSQPLRVDCISEIDIYKVEPWDLPGMSRLKTRDLEWYFFSMLDKKYGNGARTNRATEKGYWKTTGKDRSVYHSSRVVGMKKTLVYHIGRAPKGQRTNWVMHEYRRVDEKSIKSGIVQDAFVLCRVFQKSGSGPKNGEQYGAPFVAEEWEVDELGSVPKAEVAEQLGFLDDICLDGDELEQILEADTPSEGAMVSQNNVTEDIEDKAGHSEEFQNTTVNDAENPCGPDEQRSFDQPIDNFDSNSAVKHEYMGESSNGMAPDSVDYILNEPLVETSDQFQFNDGTFLETNDLSNPVDTDASGFDMLEEYLNFYDATDGFQDMLFDPAMLIGSDGFHGELPSFVNKDACEAAETAISPIGVEDNKTSDIPSSSKPVITKFGSDYQHPFMKQASQMLGKIPAPPAFASEYPKDIAARLGAAAAQASSSSIHVTAGLIQIRDLTLLGSGGGEKLQHSGRNYNIVLSFGSLMESSFDHHHGKSLLSAATGGWLFSFFFWVLMLLSLSFKIGTFIYAR